MRIANRAKRFIDLLAAALALPILITIHATASGSQPGYYQTVENDGIWWFQAPDGTHFFSLGVNVVNVGASREEYRAGNPGYGSFRYYPTTEAWATATLQRLHDWNFNTIGGWSHSAVEEGPLPFTPVLSLGETAGGLWGDMFSPEASTKFDEAAKRTVLPLRENPHLLGYFSDNELGWWSDAIVLHFIKQPRANYTRQVLINLLRTHYQNNFRSLQHDFIVGKSTTFDELGLRDRLLLRAGGQGRKLIDDFMFLLAQRYYQLCHDSIRHYDDHHLILGDRFAAWYPPSVARAAGPYVDVISINTGADWKSGELSPFLLRSLHNLTGKPVLISEFYMCATENRSGNKNSRALFPTVATQHERAAAFRKNFTTLAALPFVIGAHWFQYFDEPTHGRPDGEDYNMGLVDIDNRPYEELTAEAIALDVTAIHGDSEDSRAVPNTTSVLSIAAPSSLWFSRPALIQEAAGPNPTPFADLYAAWDSNYLYLVLHAAGYFDPKFYPGSRLPLADAMEWTVGAEGTRPIRIRFGDKDEPTVDGQKVAVEMRRTSTRFTVMLTLPSSSFGKSKFADGRLVSLQSNLTSYGHLHAMHWDQSLRLISVSHQEEK